MKINWKDPTKELPNNDKRIALLFSSLFEGSKWPETYEIVFGRTFYRVSYGKKVLFISSNFIGDTLVEEAIAWADAKEFEKPEFVKEKR